MAICVHLRDLRAIATLRWNPGDLWAATIGRSGFEGFLAHHFGRVVIDKDFALSLGFGDRC